MHSRCGVLLLWLAGLAPAGAGVINGVVLDHYSGRPIQRALVTLRPVAGRGSGTLVARSARSGQFVFSPIPAGAYLLSVARTGYATLHHGQKAWNAPARPVFLTEDEAPFLELRLRRLGAVAGMVLDENDIGFPNVDVYLYKPARPPQLAGQTKTDERGHFRIGGLAPGRYLVRSGAAQLEDGAGLLPSFHPQSLTVEDARTVQVEFDQQTSEVTVRPYYGRLFRLSGRVYVPPVSPTPPPVTLTLANDMGRKTQVVSDSGDYSFDALAPGEYELSGKTILKDGPAGSHAKLVVDKDTITNVDVKRFPQLLLNVAALEGKPDVAAQVVVQARPVDLAGEGAVQTLAPSRSGLSLAPGRWEFFALTPPEMYVAAIEQSRTRRGREPARGDMWTEVVLSSGALEFVTVQVSSRSGAVRGSVLAGAGQPGIGAPVFLEPVDRDGRKRLMDPRVTISGLEGEYSFEGVPPGRYRLVSSFEFLEPDERDMAEAKPKLITLKEGARAAEDLDLWVRP